MRAAGDHLLREDAQRDRPEIGKAGRVLRMLGVRGELIDSESLADTAVASQDEVVGAGAAVTDVGNHVDPRCLDGGAAGRHRRQVDPRPQQRPPRIPVGLYGHAMYSRLYMVGVSPTPRLSPRVAPGAAICPGERVFS